MDTTLLQPEIQDFIHQHLETDVRELALQKNPFPTVNWTEILNQIAAKQKAKQKLPTWFATDGIYYPSKISIEQTSSEITAQYKSNLVSGNSLIDLSGGFGVDDYYFSKKVNQVVHCEWNDGLSKIVSYNFERLGTKKITCLTGDSLKTLKQQSIRFDWIYLDPSRRNESKGKVFMLRDCSPDVPELLDTYFNFSNKILLKTAPILDITAALSELKYVVEIHCLAVQNEMKELLFILEKDYVGSITTKCVNITGDRVETFQFNHLDILAPISYSLPEKYLFEPNAAVMKSGGFSAVSAQFSLSKLHPHSHLFTAEKMVEFPGRIFEIERQFPYNKSEMKYHLEGKKANVTIRNFPETVENIRKKWRIKDGGEQYVFFTTDLNNSKIVLLCKKIK